MLNWGKVLTSSVITLLHDVVPPNYIGSIAIPMSKQVAKYGYDKESVRFKTTLAETNPSPRP